MNNEKNEIECRMKTVRYIDIALICLSILTGCTQADSPEERQDLEDVISFRTDLAKIMSTRGTTMTGKDFNEFYVTSYFGGHDFQQTAIDQLIYFKDCLFTKDADKTEFKSATNYIWPVTSLEFFAYHPSLTEMRGASGSSNGCIMSNHTDGFRLSGFQVAKKISDQIDFVTAHAKQTYKSSADRVVNLGFTHALTQIEIRGSFKDDPKYNLEVAGVRIGNPAMQGNFNFCGDSHMPNSQVPDGYWENAEVSDCVEYIYGTTDNILTVDNQSVVSLMGKGGNAMVIPTKNQAWDAKGDVSNTNKKGYFAVLVRATTTDGKSLFPALGLEDEDQVEIVYFSVAKDTGKILSRVYPGIRSYFTNEARTIRYNIPVNAVIKRFGWAAVPVNMDWVAGKKYVYDLNYSSGLGIRVPDDPSHPADPILGGDLKFTVTFEEWGEPVNKDIDMPSKKNQTNSGQ